MPGKQMFMGLPLLLIGGRRDRLRNGTLPEMLELAAPGAPSAAVMTPEAAPRAECPCRGRIMLLDKSVRLRREVRVP